MDEDVKKLIWEKNKKSYILVQCAVCLMGNRVDSLEEPLINFCHYCGNPLVDHEEIKDLVRLPPRPKEEPEPEPPARPTGFLATFFNAGSEVAEYGRRTAARAEVLARNGVKFRAWRMEGCQLRAAFIHEKIWQHHYHSLSILDSVAAMNGIQFEKMLCQLFVTMGYRVQMTPASGDQGADLILTGRHEVRTAVQAKRRVAAVSNKAIQEVLGAMTYYECDIGLVVTNSGFTPGAMQLASCDERLDLWDGAKLARVYADQSPEEVPQFDQAEYDSLIQRLKEARNVRPSLKYFRDLQRRSRKGTR
jgi:hypothetical protein